MSYRAQAPRTSEWTYTKHVEINNFQNNEEIIYIPKAIHLLSQSYFDDNESYFDVSKSTNEESNNISNNIQINNDSYFNYCF